MKINRNEIANVASTGQNTGLCLSAGNLIRWFSADNENTICRSIEKLDPETVVGRWIYLTQNVSYEKFLLG